MFTRLKIFTALGLVVGLLWKHNETNKQENTNQLDQTSHHPLKISVDTKGADATPTAPPSPLYVATHALFMAARGAEVSSPAETNFEHVETVTLSALLNFVCAHCKHMDREAISRGMRALLSLSLTPADARSGDTDCLSLSLPQLFARVQASRGLASSPFRVFLGGACGASTWRRDIARPWLEQRGLPYYDPLAEVIVLSQRCHRHYDHAHPRRHQEWHPGLLVVEDFMKAYALQLLFVIDGSTRGISSLVEAAALCEAQYQTSLKVGHMVTRKVDSPQYTLVLILGDVAAGTTLRGTELGVEEAKDLNRGRHYLRALCRARGVPVFDSIAQGLPALEA